MLNLLLLPHCSQNNLFYYYYIFNIIIIFVGYTHFIKCISVEGTKVHKVHSNYTVGTPVLMSLSLTASRSLAKLWRLFMSSFASCCVVCSSTKGNTI